MSAKQCEADFPEVQSAIYGVALSLDSLLVNGIAYGVLQPALNDGFLRRAAENLLRELAALEKHESFAPVAIQPKVSALLGELRSSCQRLIDRIMELRSFQTMLLPDLRKALAQIPALRLECVKAIEELEGVFQTPKRFYPSRPQHARLAMDSFLGNLETMFDDELASSPARRVDKRMPESPGIHETQTIER